VIRSKRCSVVTLDAGEHARRRFDTLMKDAILVSKK